MQGEYDYLFKVLLIGNSGVGKSSLLVRFADDTFSENFMPTIGVDFKIRTVEVDGKTIKLQIWDTAGQERFKTITASYYKGAHGIIVTYDITDRESFNAVQTWMNEVEKNASDNISRILVGNKCDLESQRQVTKEEGQELAEHFNVRFLETSAKECMNVEDAFTMMTREMKNRVTVIQPKRQGNDPQATKSLSKAKDIKKQKSGCC
eukprot:CAMPEP_0176360718 /NCGR_PEP_ID=MMETSP0126-20121128/17266_1 /TAXON_ID=141414 ORGANISM="Strombidinopsis acuminatum, Strain SPMC142" /NCGR_SAMPLE_ID=MMETSP0126 /ASSEMBLY_ACC=CAM_ASM_000229 /LENGTH=205 /DNA_ID=CAMNT_0017716031 /DNA_START=138 /DNA_END=755 /DNA_ORIENTATION=+